MSDPVQAQYEAYPYPARDPRDERKRLIAGSPSHLDEVNHYLFAGGRDFAKPFRALVAGGGTGDAAIMLAQQLSDHAAACGATPGEVVYLDLSAAARGIAEARARERGLANIAFHTAALDDLATLGLGRFDYIDCCGVLHHLADPAAGLAALTGALAEGGGLGIMVYAPYGRTGVYPAQDLLRRLGGDLDLKDRVALARRLLDALPATNWLNRNPFLGDHRRSDAELVDLLLHPRDRAFTVPELAEMVASAGLRLAAFIEPARYDPATYLRDPKLLRRLDGLDPVARAACAEALAGNIRKHIVYLLRAEEEREPIARPDGPEAVPLLHNLDGPRLAKSLGWNPVMTAGLDGLKLRLPLPPLAAALLARIDGKSDLAALHAALQAQNPGLDWDGFKLQFDRLYAVLNGLNHMLIAKPGHRTS